MKYFKKMVGNKVYLSPVNVDDAIKYLEWLNDYEIAKYIGQIPKIVTIEGEKEFLTNLDDKYIFAIIDKDSDTLIGNISLNNINNIHRTCELGIMIGDKKYHSSGYGSDAIMLILDYGFNHLNLNNIMLRAIAFNKRAIRAYEKCGFKTFGVWKNSYYFEGKYHDEVYMNILKEDFNKDN